MEQSQRIILGKNVARHRSVCGFTQESLAELAEIDRRYLQRIERGTANPGVEILRRIKTALDTSWDELLD